MKKIIPILVLFTACSTFSCNQKKLPVKDLGEFNLHTEMQEKYLKSTDHSKIEGDGKHDWDKPNPVTFTIEDSTDKNNYDIYYSYNYRFDDSKIMKDHHITSSKKEISLTNLELGKTYYFKVTANNKTIERGTFKTTPGIIRNLNVDGIKNVRDMGGYQTSLGYFKPNMIYRLSELNHDGEIGPDDSFISAKGAKTLIDDFKIKTEIDLRMENEAVGPCKTTSILKLTYGGDVTLKPIRIDYNGFNILSETEKAHIKEFFEVISDTNNYPLCFHCHIGTDRTGMFAAAIHSLLGCDLDHIYRDYMFSNFAYIGGSRTEDGINNSFINQASEYTGSTLAEKTYNLLKEKVGIPTSQLDNIRDILLEK